MNTHIVPFSELAMHMGIAGKYISDFRFNSLNSVSVRVIAWYPDGTGDETYHNGLPSELLPIELRDFINERIEFKLETTL